MLLTVLNLTPRLSFCSLAIHIPQCYEKWFKVEDQKDPKDRREPPEPPEELDNPLPTKPEEVDAFNSR